MLQKSLAELTAMARSIQTSHPSHWLVFVGWLHGGVVAIMMVGWLGSAAGSVFCLGRVVWWCDWFGRVIGLVFYLFAALLVLFRFLGFCLRLRVCYFIFLYFCLPCPLPACLPPACRPACLGTSSCVVVGWVVLCLFPFLC